MSAMSTLVPFWKRRGCNSFGPRHHGFPPYLTQGRENAHVATHAPQHPKKLVRETCSHHIQHVEAENLAAPVGIEAVNLPRSLPAQHLDRQLSIGSAPMRHVLNVHELIARQTAATHVMQFLALSRSCASDHQLFSRLCRANSNNRASLVVFAPPARSRGGARMAAESAAALPG